MILSSVKNSQPYFIYGLLCSFYVLISMMSNLVYKKFIILPLGFGYELEISSGALLYPFTYFLIDIMTELYGKEVSQCCIGISVLNALVMISILQVISMLKVTSWSLVSSETFDLVFKDSKTSFLSSIIAYSISQPLDVFLYLKMRKYFSKKYLGILNLVSSSLSLFLDTAIVVTLLAVFGIIHISNLFSLIVSSFIFKFFLILSLSLFFKYSVNLFKQRT